MPWLLSLQPSTVFEVFAVMGCIHLPLSDSINEFYQRGGSPEHVSSLHSSVIITVVATALLSTVRTLERSLVCTPIVAVESQDHEIGLTFDLYYESYAKVLELQGDIQGSINLLELATSRCGLCFHLCVRKQTGTVVLPADRHAACLQQPCSLRSCAQYLRTRMFQLCT
jgi:hypothetical protein